MKKQLFLEKKAFESPSMQVMRVNKNDVICTSEGNERVQSEDDEWD